MISVTPPVMPCAPLRFEPPYHALITQVQGFVSEVPLQNKVKWAEAKELPIFVSVLVYPLYTSLSSQLVILHIIPVANVSENGVHAKGSIEVTDTIELASFAELFCGRVLARRLSGIEVVKNPAILAFKHSAMHTYHSHWQTAHSRAREAAIEAAREG